MEQVTVKTKPNASNKIGTKDNMLLLVRQFSVKISKITDFFCSA